MIKSSVAEVLCLLNHLSVSSLLAWIPHISPCILLGRTQVRYSRMNLKSHLRFLCSLLHVIFLYSYCLSTVYFTVRSIKALTCENKRQLLKL